MEEALDAEIKGDSSITASLCEQGRQYRLRKSTSASQDLHHHTDSATKTTQSQSKQTHQERRPSNTILSSSTASSTSSSSQSANSFVAQPGIDGLPKPVLTDSNSGRKGSNQNDSTMSTDSAVVHPAANNAGMLEIGAPSSNGRLAAAPLSAPPSTTTFPRSTDDSAASPDSSTSLVHRSNSVSIESTQTTGSSSAAIPYASPAKKKRARTATVGSTGSNASASTSVSTANNNNSAVTVKLEKEKGSTISAKRGSSAASETPPAHKRKISQNSLWHASRAILGQGIGGIGTGPTTSPGNSTLASMVNGTMHTSPVRSSYGVQAGIDGTGNVVYSPASTITGSTSGLPSPTHSILTTPRHQTAAGQIMMVDGADGGIFAHPHQAPHTIAHSYIPSNLGPHALNSAILPQNQHLIFNPAFISPSHPNIYTGSMSMTPQHSQQQQFVPMSAPPSFAGTAGLPSGPGDFNAASALATFNFTPTANFDQDMHSGLLSTVQVGPQIQQPGIFAQQMPSQNANVVGGRQALSRTPSTLSFGASTAATNTTLDYAGNVTSSQESSSNVSMSMLDNHQSGQQNGTLLPSTLQAHHSNGETKIQTRPTTSGDPESAAELMLFLAASPSPKQPSKKVNTGGAPLGGDLGGMKGRKLFAGEDEPDNATSNNAGKAAEQVEHSPTGRPLRSTSMAGKTKRQQQQQMQQAQQAQLEAGPMLSSTAKSINANPGMTESDDMHLAFETSNSHQAYPLSDIFGNSPFNDSAHAFSSQLAQPFEYHQSNAMHDTGGDTAIGSNQQPFQYAQFGMADSASAIAVDAEYGNSW